MGRPLISVGIAMSERFQMLVDQDVKIEEANDLLARVLNRYREDGLITGEPDADCVLGGEGYRPGPAILMAYEPRETGFPFWELRTCGIEPQVGRHFNYWAYGPSCEGFSCPLCRADYVPGDERKSDLFSDAVGQWAQESGPALVRCAVCAGEVPLSEWLWRPPLGFGNLSFTFWNWPSLRSPVWRIDVQEITEQATGHKLVYTYGRI
jgi:hypothetical protein